MKKEREKMYIRAKNLYLNDGKNILFDLNHYRIFYVTNPVCDYLQGNRKKLSGLNKIEIFGWKNEKI